MAKIHSYLGKEITVTWDKSRCIHAAECIKQLRVVFDTREKPWVRPDNSEAEIVAQVIHDCPTGALKYSSEERVKPEQPDSLNSVLIRPHGPLYVRGDLKLKFANEELPETRVALCRCGQSQNKPFCDNSHYEATFRDRGAISESERATAKIELNGALEISVTPNGPLKLRGPHDIIGTDQSVTSRMASSLCRCGQSQNKPFCDGSHKQGFLAD